MVWAGFTCDCKITLEVIKGNKTAAKFRDEILHDVILPFQQAHPAYKRANNIMIEDWLAHSPDVNVIESTPGIYFSGLLLRDNQLQTIRLSSVAVQEEWNNLDQNKLR